MLNAGQMAEIMELQKLSGMEKFIKRTIAEELNRQKIVSLILSTNLGMCIGQIMKAEAIADNLIDNNVVPVVRCKECKHRVITNVSPPYCKKGILLAKDNDFCSLGERKDND